MEGAAKTQRVTEMSPIAGNPRAADTLLSSPVKKASTSSAGPMQSGATTFSTVAAAMALLSCVFKFLACYFFNCANSSWSPRRIYQDVMTFLRTNLNTKTVRFVMYFRPGENGGVIRQHQVMLLLENMG